MSVAIQEVPKAEVADFGDCLTEIYQAAFTPPPYAKSEKDAAEFKRWFPDHITRCGFRLRLAVDKVTGQPVGFAYGFDQTDDRFFLKAVAGGLPDTVARDWLSNYFRLAEIAVLPAWQGRGIGQGLHDTLLSGLPHPTALLATLAQDTPAYRLYLRRGWQVLRSQIQLPSTHKPYRIMGYCA